MEVTSLGYLCPSGGTGLKYSSTPDTVNNLGLLYKKQDKLDEAEQMFGRVLRGYEEVLGSDSIGVYRPALKMMFHMGTLYRTTLKMKGPEEEDQSEEHKAGN